MTFLIQQTLIYGVPLLIVALAGVFAERSGIINLALEGINPSIGSVGDAYDCQSLSTRSREDWGVPAGAV